VSWYAYFSLDLVQFDILTLSTETGSSVVSQGGHGNGEMVDEWMALHTAYRSYTRGFGSRTSRPSATFVASGTISWSCRHSFTRDTDWRNVVPSGSQRHRHQVSTLQQLQRQLQRQLQQSTTPSEQHERSEHSIIFHHARSRDYAAMCHHG